MFVAFVDSFSSIYKSQRNQFSNTVSNTKVIKPFKFVFAVFAFFLGGGDGLAQDSPVEVDCQTASKLQRKKNQPTIAFGVMNGRARVLVKAEYSAAAAFVKVRGSVNVSELTDPRGCVSSAKVTSGHLFLRTASVRAALKSSFEPVLISGNPVWGWGLSFTTT